MCLYDIVLGGFFHSTNWLSFGLGGGGLWRNWVGGYSRRVVLSLGGVILIYILGQFKDWDRFFVFRIRTCSQNIPPLFLSFWKLMNISIFSSSKKKVLSRIKGEAQVTCSCISLQRFSFKGIWFYCVAVLSLVERKSSIIVMFYDCENLYNKLWWKKGLGVWVGGCLCVDFEGVNGLKIVVIGSVGFWV